MSVRPEMANLTPQEARIMRKELKDLGLKCWECKHWPGQGENHKRCKVNSPSFPYVDICFEEPDR